MSKNDSTYNNVVSTFLSVIDRMDPDFMAKVKMQGKESEFFSLLRSFAPLVPIIQTKPEKIGLALITSNDNRDIGIVIFYGKEMGIYIDLFCSTIGLIINRDENLYAYAELAGNDFVNVMQSKGFLNDVRGRVSIKGAGLDFIIDFIDIYNMIKEGNNNKNNVA